MAQFALKWILMHEAVTCAIPGAKRVDQSQDNFSNSASELPELDHSTSAKGSTRSIVRRLPTMFTSVGSHSR